MDWQLNYLSMNKVLLLRELDRLNDTTQVIDQREQRKAYIYKELVIRGDYR